MVQELCDGRGGENQDGSSIASGKEWDFLQKEWGIPYRWIVPKNPKGGEGLGEGLCCDS